jgi:GTP cyclohydrolase I
MNQRDPYLAIPDVQSSADTRRLTIDRVGIKSIRHPVRLLTAGGETQHTIATFSMTVRLPAEVKGTHMSRFIELLEQEKEAIDLRRFDDLLHRMLTRLNAEAGDIEMTFPYFIAKTAPVSGVTSLMDYQVTLAGSLSGGRTSLTTTVVAPVTSLCPCSKEISAYGAHNQRSHITLSVRGAGSLSIENLIRIAEDQASAEVYGILKRTDEKFVTERAYDNPKFVEDLVRDLAAALEADARVEAYRVEAENFESIHNHSAFAVIERDKALGPRTGN